MSDSGMFDSICFSFLMFVFSYVLFFLCLFFLMLYSKTKCFIVAECGEYTHLCQDLAGSQVYST
jgi:hypothetical protein